MSVQVRVKAVFPSSGLEEALPRAHSAPVHEPSVSPWPVSVQVRVSVVLDTVQSRVHCLPVWEKRGEVSMTGSGNGVTVSSTPLPPEPFPPEPFPGVVPGAALQFAVPVEPETVPVYVVVLVGLTVTLPPETGVTEPMP